MLPRIQANGIALIIAALMAFMGGVGWKWALAQNIPAADKGALVSLVLGVGAGIAGVLLAFFVRLTFEGAARLIFIPLGFVLLFLVYLGYSLPLF